MSMNIFAPVLYIKAHAFNSTTSAVKLAEKYNTEKNRSFANKLVNAKTTYIETHDYQNASEKQSKAMVKNRGLAARVAVVRMQKHPGLLAAQIKSSAANSTTSLQGSNA